MQVSQQSKEEIYDELKERILTLQALPHEKLSENAVARQMHVSRTIVRGALSRLTDEGLITVLPQSGTFVNCISMKKVQQTIYAYNTILARLLEELCSHKLSKEENAQIRETEMRMQSLSGNTEERMQRDSLLIELFARLCQKEYIVSFLNGMNFDLFDKILSFDRADCSKYGFTFMPQGQVFSKPKNMQVSKAKKTDIFFAGMGVGRVEILNETALRLEGEVEYKMHVVGVPEDKQERQTHIAYNQPISYEEEMQYTYNTNTVLDVVKEGQSGITLRICEALLFNKKILTNNESVKYMPFYNPIYIWIYKDASEIDVSFIKDNRPVDYGIPEDYFSPKHIIRLLTDDESIGVGV